MATELWAVILVLFASVLGAFGSLFFKRGSAHISRNIFKIIKNKILILGFFVYIFSAFLYMMALRRGELSVLYPLVSTSYIWSAVLAVYFLNEKMNKFKWVGILLIIMGVIFIGLGS